MKRAIAILCIMFSVNSFAADDVLISACVNKITKDMRHINAPQACKRTEYLLSWNQKGPQGIQGAIGPQGPAGTESASTCTQESLVGTWWPDNFVQPQKINVDANGNFTLNSWEDDKYDENGNIIGRINKSQKGTLKISVTQNSGCSVDWSIITHESYVNPGDSFLLSPDKNETLSNMKLNNEADEIKYNEFYIQPAFNGNSETPAVFTSKLLKIQNGL